MSTRSPRWVLCALLTAAPAGAQQGETVDVAPILSEALEYEGWDLTGFEDRLVELGFGASAPMFELLCEGEVRVEDHSLSLGHVGEELILAAFGRLPSASVVQMLAELVTPLEAADLRAAQLLLGAVGDARDLGLLVRLSTPVEVDASVPLAAREGFADAAWRILMRHREETWLVSKQYAAAPAGLRAALLDAAGRAKMEGELELFSGLLGVHRELDVIVLGMIARVATPWCEDQRTLGAVRGMLKSDDPRELTAAVLAITALEDSASVDALVELAPDASPGLLAHIDRALARITGRNFHGDFERWRAWRLDDAVWWRGEAQVLLRDLHGSNAARAATAVNELARHRMYHRELEAELLASLDPARPDLCALKCAVLARIGSPRVIEHLEAMRVSGDETLSRAASAALEVISARLRLDLAAPVAGIRR